MNVDTMSIAQVNNALVSRHSRTSGTEEARRQRLKRFLEFEKQKERRSQYVQQVRQEKADREEMDGQQDDVCPCNYEEKEKEKAADGLLALRTQDTLQTLREHIAELDECYEVVVAENLRLNHRINNLEMRLSHVENRSDSPPPLIFTESNPNWVLDTAFTA